MAPSAGPTAADVDQRVIKNGSLDLVVDRAQDAITSISGLAAAHNGFVQSSSVNELRDGTHTGYVTIRVPADSFEAAMAAVKGLANVVKNESVSGQDVTEQYTDLEARLRNAKSQEETFLGVLDRAKTVEDILAVQRELSNVRYQIESLEGQRQYLENQTSFSTIGVTLSEEPEVRIPTKTFRPWAAVKSAAQALVGVLQTLVIWAIWILIVGIGILIPFLLFWALVLWLLRAAWRRWFARSVAAPSRKK
jgi:hypothetical protein